MSFATMEINLYNIIKDNERGKEKDSPQIARDLSNEIDDLNDRIDNLKTVVLRNLRAIRTEEELEKEA